MMIEIQQFQVSPVVTRKPYSYETSTVYIANISAEASTFDEARAAIVRMSDAAIGTAPVTRLSLDDISAVFRSFSGGTEKIAAIKKLRELSGCGLKEAKDVVEGCFGQ